jgi:thioredoxin 1
MGKPITVTDADFEEKVVKAGMPVLVDFWAPWCGPCHAVAPILEEIAAEYEGKALVAKLNTDENPGIFGALQIKSIPFIAAFVGPRVVKYTIGVQPKQVFTQMMEAVLQAEAAKKKPPKE